jgi:hypothetical protein
MTHEEAVKETLEKWEKTLVELHQTRTELAKVTAERDQLKQKTMRCFCPSAFIRHQECPVHSKK